MKLDPLTKILINALLMGSLATVTALSDGIPTVEELYVAIMLGLTTLIGQLLLYFRPPKSNVLPGQKGNSELEKENGPKLGYLIW